MTCTQPGCGGSIHDGYCDTERSYRTLARLTPDEDRRIELVDMANAIRPRTLT